MDVGLPCMVVVDDLDLLFDGEFEFRAPPTPDVVQRLFLHLVALLRHATDFVRDATGRPCSVVVCLSSEGRYWKEVQPIAEREMSILHVTPTVVASGTATTATTPMGTNALQAPDSWSLGVCDSRTAPSGPGPNVTYGMTHEGGEFVVRTSTEG